MYYIVLYTQVQIHIIYFVCTYIYNAKVLLHPGLVQIETSLFIPTLVHMLLCYSFSQCRSSQCQASMQPQHALWRWL